MGENQAIIFSSAATISYKADSDEKIDYDLLMIDQSRWFWTWF